MSRKARVALYGKEDYMESLIDYLCKNGHGVIEPRLYTEKELLRRQAMAGEIDLLLLGEELVDTCRDCFDRIGQVMILTEEEQTRTQGNCRFVFRYRPAGETVKEMLNCIAENDGIRVQARAEKKITAECIAVYSPFGGTEVTDLALDLAREKSRKKKTLYVSMQLFSDFAANGTGREKKGREAESFPVGMSEVVFYLKERKEKLALKLESLVTRADGVEGIGAVEDYRDLYAVTQEDIGNLLEVLSGPFGCECIVFDIGCFFLATLFLMEQCQSICLPAAQTEKQKKSKEAFFAFLKRSGKEKLLSRCVEK